MMLELKLYDKMGSAHPVLKLLLRRRASMSVICLVTGIGLLLWYIFSAVFVWVGLGLAESEKQIPRFITIPFLIFKPVCTLFDKVAGRSTLLLTIGALVPAITFLIGFSTLIFIAAIYEAITSAIRESWLWLYFHIGNLFKKKCYTLA